MNPVSDIMWICVPCLPVSSVSSDKISSEKLCIGVSRSLPLEMWIGVPKILSKTLKKDYGCGCCREEFKSHVVVAIAIAIDSPTVAATVAIAASNAATAAVEATTAAANATTTVASVTTSPNVVVVDSRFKTIKGLTKVSL
jgi:hypothetical protein